jgi:hypothetical protein
MILEAAKSIAAATSALVKAASAAQRELIDQGKVRGWKEVQHHALSRVDKSKGMKRYVCELPRQ